MSVLSEMIALDQQIRGMLDPSKEVSMSLTTDYIDRVPLKDGEPVTTFTLSEPQREEIHTHIMAELEWRLEDWIDQDNWERSLGPRIVCLVRDALEHFDGSSKGVIDPTLL